MPPTSDIILIGAGRSPHTKQRRRRNGYPKRNVWIGSREIRTNMRIPVDVEFVKANYDQIVAAVGAGVLLVEYKLDKFVDPTELKTLAFGSDAEKEAYEESIRGRNDKIVQRAKTLSEEKRVDDEENARLSVLGDFPIGEDGNPILPEYKHEGAEGAVNIDNATRLTGGLQVDTPLETGDNFAGSHAESITSPRQLADAVIAARNPAEGVESGAPVDDALEGGEDEPEYHPGADVGEQPTRSTDDPNYKPLPDGWKQSAKAELLSLCEERGIDTSDAPSNKELRKRLENYERA